MPLLCQQVVLLSPRGHRNDVQLNALTLLTLPGSDEPKSASPDQLRVLK